MRIHRLALCLALTASAAPALADTRCTGRMSGAFENIEVPPGAVCTLVNARVDGTVKVYGKLKVLDGMRGTWIGGNIQAEPGNRGVEIGSGVEIGGSVQVVSALGPTRILNATVDGSVQFRQSFARLVVRNSTIGSDLQMEQNSVSAASSGAIFYNTIEGNLQCQANVPPPVGGDNVVGGNKEDQCARF